MGTVNLSPLLGKLQDDGRAAESYEKSHKDRLSDGLSQLPGHSKDGQEGQRHLEHPPGENGPLDLHQSVE